MLSTLRSDQEQRHRTGEDRERCKAVERAAGVLMERHGLTADTAAEPIRRMATREGVAVGEVATRLVRRPPSGRQRRSGR